MTLANSNDEDEQSSQERPRGATEAYPTKSEELSRAGPTLVRRGQHLDVDEILSRSFKDVK